MEAALTTSPSLAHCHKRVMDAGCCLSPEWALGARLFVPLTREQLEESGKKIADHHIIALASDVEHIRAALRHLKFKDRPKVVFTDNTDRQQLADRNEGMGGRGSGGVTADVDDGLVDVVVEDTYAPTDSSLGYPEHLYADGMPHLE